jgi:hypothetical protein
MTTEHFECICDSNEHMITFKYMKNSYDTNEPELYCSIYLNQYRGLLKRIWTAIKYVFGYKCRYGHWDCWTMKPADCDRMISLLEQFKKEN